MRPEESALSLEITLPKDGSISYTKILGKFPIQKRSTIIIKESKTTLIISIKAKDATALRASTNSILRDLQVIEATKLK